MVYLILVTNLVVVAWSAIFFPADLFRKVKNGDISKWSTFIFSFLLNLGVAGIFMFIYMIPGLSYGDTTMGIMFVWLLLCGCSLISIVILSVALFTAKIAKGSNAWKFPNGSAA